jgi:hypothetical protein
LAVTEEVVAKQEVVAIEEPVKPMYGGHLRVISPCAMTCLRTGCCQSKVTVSSGPLGLMTSWNWTMVPPPVLRTGCQEQPPQSRLTFSLR